MAPMGKAFGYRLLIEEERLEFVRTFKGMIEAYPNKKSANQMSEVCGYVHTSWSLFLYISV